MPKLEDLKDKWHELYCEWIGRNGESPKVFEKLVKVEKKIAKIRDEIRKLYIGDKVGDVFLL